MPISQLGAINTTALIVPDIYVQIVPPTTLNLNGVPSNVLAVVGTASWGPVNAPTVIGSMSDYVRAFGPINYRPYDMGSVVAQAVQQGANNFLCVRAGLTGAASATATCNDSASASAMTFTSRYTGVYGNQIKVRITKGPSDNGSTVYAVTATVSMPNREPEVFPNIIGTIGSGATLWTKLAAAINNGISGIRGPSEIILATTGIAIGSAIDTTVTLVNGADGTDSGTNDAAAITGSNTVSPKTGMYALSDSRASVMVLADVTLNWSTIQSFAVQEGIYSVVSGGAGETITNAVVTKKSAGVTEYNMKVLFGDHCYWYDSANATTRLVPATGFVAGRLANLSPEQSSLNKPIYGITGTQRTTNNQLYSNAELQTLIENGLDVVTNPSPGGPYFATRSGHNASLNPVINGDNYTRLTNYIAKTLDAGMGIYIGKLQSPDVRRQAKATLETFLSNMESQGQIGNADGEASFSVRIDSLNNPASRVSLGYLQADVKVQYLSVIEKFLINVEGGQSVKVERLSTDFAG
jgi:uncharacterized protein